MNTASAAWTDLDSASGRPLHPAAREALLAAYEAGYADPRRLHHAGRRARAILDNAREAVAECLAVRADEVTFTGSGTEAVHRGVLGLARGRRRFSDRLLVSAVEHSSVLHAAEWATQRFGTAAVGETGGIETVGVDATGRLDLAALDAALTRPAALVALQSANHEVGTVQPVAAAGERAARAGVPLFLDACASMGYAPLPAPDAWAVAAGSAHKWGGPAGVGVLVVRKGARWRDPSPADERADVRGIGFEDVPGALAAAAALRAARDEGTADARMRALVDRIRVAVPQRVSDVEVVGDPQERLPHLVTFSCLYVEGEALVSALDAAGFGIGSGSACTASTHEPSHVLAAMGALTQGNVRVSVHAETTTADIERFLDALTKIVPLLRAEIGA